MKFNSVQRNKGETDHPCHHHDAYYYYCYYKQTKKQETEETLIRLSFV